MTNNSVIIARLVLQHLPDKKCKTHPSTSCKGQKAQSFIAFLPASPAILSFPCVAPITRMLTGRQKKRKISKLFMARIIPVLPPQGTRNFPFPLPTLEILPGEGVPGCPPPPKFFLSCSSLQGKIREGFAVSEDAFSPSH